MQKIVFLKDAEGHKEGEVLEINANDAHRLIDGGKARLFHQDRMLSSDHFEPKGRYRVRKIK